MTDRVAENYLKAFLSRHPVRVYKKGEIIIFQGEAPRSAYGVKSGTVKAYNISVTGDEKPVAFYQESSLFPASWIYGKAPSAVYYYEAFSPKVEVYVLDRNELLSFIKRSPEMLYSQLENAISDQLGATLRLNALQHSKASDKLIYTLHYLALTHGEVNHVDGSATIILDLTHQDFANLTGLTRETAATELNRLKKNGIIEYGKNTSYKIYMNKLNQLQNDQFISDIQPAKLPT